MSKTAETIDALKTDMQDAADEAELTMFMKEIAAVTKALSHKHRFDPQIAAYALACVACSVADVAGNRHPVMCALADSWPDLFREITEEDFDRLQRKRP